MPFLVNGNNPTTFNLVWASKGINTSLSKFNRNSNTVWTKAVEQDVAVLTTSIAPGENHIGTDRKVLVYGPIDASLYKAIKFTVTGASAEQAWNTYYFDIGFGSGTDSEAGNLDNMTANVVLGRGYTDYYGNQDIYSFSGSQEVTLTFAEDTGDVYVFMGVVNGNGYGEFHINIASTATIIPR